MLRAMMFIDLENFEISKDRLFSDSCKRRGVAYFSPKLDYLKFPKEIVKMIKLDDVILTNTIVFFPKPDEFLRTDPIKLKKYNWRCSLGNRDFVTIVEGRHVARPAKGYNRSSMRIDVPDSYYVDEKGTDINVATHLLTKGFHNSYDIALILSSDTDYIPVIDVLRSIGKLVIVVSIDNNLSNQFNGHVDATIDLNEEFFNANKLDI